MNKTFLMTVDIDGWDSTLKFYGITSTNAFEQVDEREGVKRLDELFQKYGIKATWFVTGEVMERYPDMVSMLKKEGHEVGCHGYTHKKQEFLSEVGKQRKSLEKWLGLYHKITDEKPFGFRAPAFRLNNTTLQLLGKLGFIYDCSVVPTYMPNHYNFLFAPKTPYHPSTANISRRGNGQILEIPVSIAPVIPIPLGAPTMRLLGERWIKFSLRKLTKHPIVFYTHPKDVMELPREKGIPSHIYKNNGQVCLNMLEEVIKFSLGQGYQFQKACDYTMTFIGKGKEGNG